MAKRKKRRTGAGPARTTISQLLSEEERLGVTDEEAKATKRRRSKAEWKGAKNALRRHGGRAGISNMFLNTIDNVPAIEIVKVYIAYRVTQVLQTLRRHNLIEIVEAEPVLIAELTASDVKKIGNRRLIQIYGLLLGVIDFHDKYGGQVWAKEAQLAANVLARHIDEPRKIKPVKLGKRAAAALKKVYYE